MATFDCFTFFKEFDVLELRMTELWDSVDWFVAVEADITFSGEPKPYFMSECERDLGNLRDELKVFRVKDLPVAVSNRWPTEILQRNAIRSAVLELEVDRDDIVLISDVDEIPRAASVDWVRAELRDDQVFAFEMMLLYYRLDVWVDQDIWIQSKAFRATMLDDLTPHEIRTMYSAPAFTLEDAGWHFSYLAPRAHTAQTVQRKFGAFSHPEVTAADLEWWPRGQRVKRSHMGNLLKPYAGVLPACVRAHPDRWRPFLAFPDGPSRADEIACEAARFTDRMQAKARKLVRALK